MYNFISIYQRTDFLMLNQIWNVGLPSFWILCIQIWVSAFSSCPYFYHFCFLFSSMDCYSFSLQELHQSIGRPHRSLHMLHVTLQPKVLKKFCSMQSRPYGVHLFLSWQKIISTNHHHLWQKITIHQISFWPYIKEDAPLKSSRFPCCVLWALSWNKNENPSTDKLSRAINYLKRAFCIR